MQIVCLILNVHISTELYGNYRLSKDKVILMNQGQSEVVFAIG